MDICCLYNCCTINDPPSVFEDKTMDLCCFHEDYNSEKLARIANAINNKNVIHLNVLYPWMCSASCSDSGRIPLDLRIQLMLPKVTLRVFTQASKYRFVHYSWNGIIRLDNSY